jgi:hypothetical protein
LRDAGERGRELEQLGVHLAASFGAEVLRVDQRAELIAAGRQRQAQAGQ